MTMENGEIAAVLEDVGMLLQIQGANPFRIRAYENAARAVEDHAVPLRAMVADGADLTELPGIGKDMARYITELVTTGRLSILDELTAQIPRSLLELVRLPGVGPKRARKLWESLGITTLDALEAAARDGHVAELDGFGAKTQQRILDGIAKLKERGNRLRLVEADERIAPLLTHLRDQATIRRVEVAGSLRRRLETIGDIDLLATAADPGAAMEHFTGFRGVAEVTMSGETRGSVVLSSGLQVDLRIVPEESWGAALQYFTGSKAHNVRVREMAVRKGLKLSEYGLFRAKGGKLIVAETEDEVYERLGLPWIPPTLREDRGEVEAALNGELPVLVEEKDIRGDLHTHTDLTDGVAPLEEMVAVARARKLKYYAVTDHAELLYMQRMTRDKMLAQRRRLQELGDEGGMVLLHGTELNIQPDGSVDWDQGFLDGFDVCVASVHSHFTQSRDEMTRRIVRALEHPCVNILGHPTARQIGRRPPIDFDVEEVFRAAARTGTALEINSFPDRLDLNDELVAWAREQDAVFAVDTDAHSPVHLPNIRFGVATAQRGWVTKAEVINAWPLGKLRRFLAKGRPGRA